MKSLKKVSGTKITNTLSSDTLKVDYTYWWSQSGPFVGMCGDPYSLAFLGTVVEIKPPATDTSALYTSQTGTIEITELLAMKELKWGNYNGQKYFSSDCFYGTNVKEGDSVIIFCYEYEDTFSIPGKNSILKVASANDPIVKSIQKYIKAGQNPLVIKQDIELWTGKGFGNELKQIIDCKETLDNK